MPLISTDIIFNIILITTLLNIRIHKSSGNIAFKSCGGGRPFRECFSRCGHSRPPMSHRPRLLIKNAHHSSGNDDDDKYNTNRYSVFYVRGTALNPLQEITHNRYCGTSFYRWKTWGTKKSSHLRRSYTQPVTSRARSNWHLTSKPKLWNFYPEVFHLFEYTCHGAPWQSDGIHGPLLKITWKWIKM